MNLYRITLLLSLFFSTSLFGQNPHFHCSHDEAMEQFFHRHPKKLEEQMELEQAIYEKMNASQDAPPPPYTLPVVVHIIHQNGPENISDDQIELAIAQLNEAFSHTGYYGGQGNGYDTQIQFCLAKQDPDGNASNGITRHNSPLTNMVMETEDIPMKDLARWEPLDYINIYVVNAITSNASGPGVAGYAYFPTSHGMPEDGLVCEAQFFGTTPAENAVLIHEMGHYLNLYHTFQGGCGNDDCLLDGDRVCDTPPDQSTFTGCNFNSCDTDLDDTSPNNPLTTDADDPTENYMDYSPFECYYAFTPGQAERMYVAIDMARSSLLDSKGCFDPCTLPITIDFTASATEIFAGQTVSFTNASTGATIYEWSLDGVVFATTEDAFFTFNDIGTFEVELFVTNADANCFERLSVFITVKCPVIPSFLPSATTLAIGEPFLATNISQNATSYEWYINGVLITTDTDLSFTFSNDGLYTVLLIATDGSCTNEISQIIEVVSGSPCQDSVLGNYFEFIPQPSGSVIMFGFDLMPDGGLIASPYTPPTGVASRFDANGNSVWQEEILIPNNGIEDMSVFDDSTVGFTIDADDLVFKLDDSGMIEWVKNLDMPTSTIELRAFSTGDGMIVYTTTSGFAPTKLFMVKFLSDGSVAWNKIYDLPQMVRLSFYNAGVGAAGEGFYLVSTVGESSQSDLGGGVAYFNDDGEVQFFKYFNEGFPTDLFLDGVDFSNDGGFFASGRIRSQTAATYDTIVVMKGDANGEVLWSKKYELPNNNQPTIMARPSGGLLLANRFNGNEGTLLAFDENGNLEFEEEIQLDGYVSDLLKRDGQMKAIVQENITTNFFYLLNLDAQGRPTDCFASAPVQTIQIIDTNLESEDVPFSLSTQTLTITDDNLGSQEYQSDLTSLPYCENPAPCDEICDNGLDDDGDGYIDCFDVDCECSNGTNCEAEEPTNNFASQIAWISDNEDASTLATPMIANLDPQNGPMPEIIVQRGDANSPGNITPFLHFFQGGGSNQANPVVLEVEGGIAVNPVSPPAIGDINGDGIPEVVMVCGDERVRAYTNYDPTANPPMELFATSDGFVVEKRNIPALADFDSDGIPEVLVGNDVFRFDLSNPTNPQFELVLDGNGDFGRIGYHTQIPFNILNGSSATSAVDILSVTDCGGDPDCEGLEIVAGTHIYSVDLDIFDGDGMEIKIQRDLNLLSPGFNFIDGYTVSADINLDGFLDVIVTSTRDYQEMGMYAWDKNGLIGFFPYPIPGGNGPSYVSIAAVANVYDDTADGYAQDFPEIICVSAYHMTAFNANVLTTNPAQPYHWDLNTNDNSGYTGATIFDFNGDGIDEICYRDPGQFRIIYGGPAPFPPGVSFNRNWTVEPCISATYGEAPVVADCDADGEAEIIFTGKLPGNNNFTYTEGNLWVLESGNLPWVACRPVWNQYAYFGVHVNDDLSIPSVQQAHHLEFPGLGSGNRPFNQVLAQMPILDENFNPFYPVPDATLAIDSSACEGDSIRVWLTVCNEGSNGLPAEMPIVFYDNDPTAVLSVPLGIPTELGTALLPDECLTMEVVIPALYNTPIHVVANVDWFFPTPFDPLSDFPTTDIAECDYENNFADFTELSSTANPPDLGPDIVLCNSSVVALDAGGPYDSYEWQDGSDEQIFTAYLPGTYWVTVQSGCGDPLSDTIEIILDQSAVFDLGPDQTLCPGETVPLSVDGFDAVTWWPEEGLNCVDCPAVNVSPTDTITYYATGQNGDCFATDSIQFFVENFEVEIEITQDGCDTVATLTAVVTGDGTYDYLWSNGDPTDEIIINQSGTYDVTVTSQGLMCEVADTVEINLGSLLVDAEVTPVECANDSTGAIDLTPAGGAPPFDFMWANGATTEDLTGLTSGSYSVTVTDATGCSAELNFDLPATAPFTVELEGDTLVSPDMPFDISATVNPSDAVLSDIIWSPDGLPPQLTVTVMITDATLFTITVIDTSGCAATDELLVRLERPGNNVYFPNVIHPNSPNGDNLGFTGFGGEAVTLIRTLKIFDRWGGLVYDGENLPPNDASAGWDGTMDGEPVNQGVYVFLAEVEFSDGGVIQVSGDVMVAR